MPATAPDRAALETDARALGAAVAELERLEAVAAAQVASNHTLAAPVRLARAGSAVLRMAHAAAAVYDALDLQELTLPVPALAPIRGRILMAMAGELPPPATASGDLPVIVADAGDAGEASAAREHAGAPRGGQVTLALLAANGSLYAVRTRGTVAPQFAAGEDGLAYPGDGECLFLGGEFRVDSVTHLPEDAPALLAFEPAALRAALVGVAADAYHEACVALDRVAAGGAETDPTAAAAQVARVTAEAATAASAGRVAMPPVLRTAASAARAERRLRY